MIDKIRLGFSGLTKGGMLYLYRHGKDIWSNGSDRRPAA